MCFFNDSPGVYISFIHRAGPKKPRRLRRSAGKKVNRKINWTVGESLKIRPVSVRSGRFPIKLSEPKLTENIWHFFPVNEQFYITFLHTNTTRKHRCRLWSSLKLRIVGWLKEEIFTVGAKVDLELQHRSSYCSWSGKSARLLKSFSRWPAGASSVVIIKYRSFVCNGVVSRWV